MFTKLLVPLDRSAIAEQAIDHAAAIASACRAAVDVVLVSESETSSILDDESASVEGQEQSDALYVRHIADELARVASIGATHAVLHGHVVESIVARARAIEADLIVMTSHGRTGLTQAWLGSNADGVIRSSRTPVLMLRPIKSASSSGPPRGAYRRMLVPLDGSDEAREVLRVATALARCSGARILLLRVVRPVPLITADAALGLLYPVPLRDEVATGALVDKAKSELADVARALVEDGLEVEYDVVAAEHVAREVLDFARAHAADLIAMSTTSRSSSRLLIGSLADKIVRETELPVLFYQPASRAVRTLIDAVREEELAPPIAI